ncbi:MAG: hypothetical protein WC708_19240 [Lentisphaeria bacterium]
MKKIFWAIVMLASLGFATYRLSAAILQNRSVKAAFTHGEKLMAKVSAYPRFANIKIYGQSSSPKGYITVSGAVHSEADASALRDLITASQPPVSVRAFIQIGTTVSPNPLVKPDWVVVPENERTGAQGEP